MKWEKLFLFALQKTGSKQLLPFCIPTLPVMQGIYSNQLHSLKRNPTTRNFARLTHDKKHSSWQEMARTKVCRAVSAGIRNYKYTLWNL